MTANSWILESLGAEKVRKATEEAGRRRLRDALGVEGPAQLSDEHQQFVAHALELRAFALLEGENVDALRVASLEAFQVARSVPRGDAPIAAAEALLRLSCLGVLGDRGADVRRLLIDEDLPLLPLDAGDWGARVWASILDIWLRLLRKKIGRASCRERVWRYV